MISKQKFFPVRHIFRTKKDSCHRVKHIVPQNDMSIFSPRGPAHNNCNDTPKNVPLKKQVAKKPAYRSSCAGLSASSDDARDEGKGIL